jgi:hypothetical protein
VILASPNLPTIWEFSGWLVLLLVVLLAAIGLAVAFSLMILEVLRR